MHLSAHYTAYQKLPTNSLTRCMLCNELRDACWDILLDKQTSLRVSVLLISRPYILR